jgi:hypothetical protein
MFGLDGCFEDSRTGRDGKMTVKGILEVGVNEQNEVVINHPDLEPDENGVGHIVFSPAQARHLAMILNEKAADAEVAVADRLHHPTTRMAGTSKS